MPEDVVVFDAKRFSDDAKGNPITRDATTADKVGGISISASVAVKISSVSTLPRRTPHLLGVMSNKVGKGANPNFLSTDTGLANLFE